MARLPVHWGFVTCHTADFPGSEVEDDEYESGDGHVGYGVYDPTHAGFGDYGEEGDEDEDGDDEDEDDAELGEFVPGVYSAVFAFEPELDTEMRLVEGELVSVFERQCRGWVSRGSFLAVRVRSLPGIPHRFKLAGLSTTS